MPTSSLTLSSSGEAMVAGDLSKDRQVLKEHEAALQRLEELQKTMIGGEKAGMCLANPKGLKVHCHFVSNSRKLLQDTNKNVLL